MDKKDTCTPQQKRADRNRLRELMEQTGLQCKSIDNVQNLFKDVIAMSLEGGLEAELDEELESVLKLRTIKERA